MNPRLFTVKFKNEKLDFKLVATLYRFEFKVQDKYTVN
jgi:hypothetical protein